MDSPRDLCEQEMIELIDVLEADLAATQRKLDALLAAWDGVAAAALAVALTDEETDEQREAEGAEEAEEEAWRVMRDAADAARRPA